MTDKLQPLKHLFAFIDRLDNFSVKETGKKSPYRLSKEAEEIKRSIQSHKKEEQ